MSFKTYYCKISYSHLYYDLLYSLVNLLFIMACEIFCALIVMADKINSYLHKMISSYTLASVITTKTSVLSVIFRVVRDYIIKCSTFFTFDHGSI